MNADEAAREIVALFARLRAEGIAVDHHWDSSLTVGSSGPRLPVDYCTVDFDENSGGWVAHYRQTGDGPWEELA